MIYTQEYTLTYYICRSLETGIFSRIVSADICQITSFDVIIGNQLMDPYSPGYFKNSLGKIIFHEYIISAFPLMKRKVKTCRSFVILARVRNYVNLSTNIFYSA